MLDYDFSKLNDREFEGFTIELLGQHLRRRVERFKPGKDMGVDGRFFISDNREVIIQCKHWIRTGVDALIRHLKKEEAPKLDKLKPVQYILTTSLQLSRKNKSDIRAALSPWVTSDSDIYGQEDLNLLLSNHPQIEERHYKLWFSSVSILSKLQNVSVKGRTDFEISDAQSFAHKYIFTSCHDEALRKLQSLGVVIITGEPGVGKTTMAKQVVVQYALKGFEICSIAESPSEAEQMWQKGVPQLFYFDDFLGRNYLDALQRHEDTHIVTLIRRVHNDPSKKFVLTSRTTVLNRAKQLTELFKVDNLNKNEFELKISNLTLIEKAKILYNHLWSSDLSKTFIDKIYENAKYLEIAQHPNYNPRLISFITDINKIEDITPEQYWNFVCKTLNDPKDIWGHVFERQLEDHGRALVRLAVFNGRDITEPHLQSAFHDYCIARNEQTGLLDKFNIAVRLTVGSVLNRHFQSTNHAIRYTLFNPSLGDYLVNHYKSDQSEIAECTMALKSIESLSNLHALYKAGLISGATLRHVLERLTTHFLNAPLSISLSYRLHLAQFTLKNRVSSQLLNREIHDFLRFLVKQTQSSEECGLQAELLAFGVEEAVLDADDGDLYKKIEVLVEDASTDEEFESLSNLLVSISHDNANQLASSLAEQFEHVWLNNVGDIVRAEGVLDDFSDPSDYSSAETALRKFIEEKVSGIGLAADYVNVDAILDRIDVQEEVFSNSSRSHRHYEGPSVGSNIASCTSNEIAMVHDLFARD